MNAALAVVDYTFRACMPFRRRLGLVALALVVVLFGFLARGSEQIASVAVLDTAGFTTFFLVLPVASLVVGDALLGSEIRSGVFTFTWLSPVRLETILLGRWIAGTAITSVALVPAVVLASSVGGASELAGPFALATVVGAACYLAVFLAIGATFRRAPAVSLLYAFLVERLLGAALSAIAQISPGWLASAVLTGSIDGLPDDRVREGVPQGGAAVARMVLITVVALLVARRGLRRLRIVGAAD
jgi:ABC-type transport system involved in multi-copper enzyme maturation permease subunit